MKKVHKIVIAAVVLVALTAAYVLVRYLPKPEKQTTAAASTEIELTDIEKDTIASMILEKGGSSLTIVKKGDAWSVDYPYPVDLDQSSFDSLASSFADVKADRLIAEHPDDLAQFGLQKPSARATAVTSDGKRVTLLVGGLTPNGYSNYVKKEGEDAVYTVSSYDITNFQKSFADFRVKTISEPVQYDKLETLYFSGPKGVFEIRKKKAEESLYEEMGDYVVVKPWKVPHSADSDGFGKLLQGLGQFEIKDFIEDAPSDYRKYGLEKPFAEFSAKDSEGHSIHLYFGSEKDEFSRYARIAGDNRVITVDAGAVRTLADTDPFAVTGKFALLVNIEEVDTVKVTTPETVLQIAIARTPAADENSEPTAVYTVNGKNAEESGFKKFYQEMIGFYEDGVNPKPAPGKPVLTISYALNEKGGNGTLEVSFVPFNRDFYQVYRGGISEFLVSRNQVEAFIRTASEYLKNLPS